MSNDLSIDERIARLRALLRNMQNESAAAREEILLATEQLLMQARDRHREAVHAHQRTMKKIQTNRRARKNRR